MLLISHKKNEKKSLTVEKKSLTVAFVAQKPLILPFLPISVNFGWLSTLL